MADSAKYRRLLVTMRDELIAQGDVEIEAEEDGDVVRKPDEDAAPLAEMNQVIASNRNRARVARLAELEAALTRLDDDPEGFGLCEDCDEPIKTRRLELMPWVRLCIECQGQREQAAERRGTRKHLTDFE